MTDRLRIVLQKKGRLAKESLSLLERSGLKFRIKENALLTHVENFPIDLLFVRDDDIPALVFDGLCDAGIVGENVLLEASLRFPNKRCHPLLPLGVCRCRLVLAVPETFDYQGTPSLEGMRIATSYPLLLNEYLAQQKICAESLILSGSVEVAPKMGMANLICDLVSSGQTLEDNQLIEVETLLESQAIFIKTSQTLNTEQEALLTMLSRRMQAVLHAVERKYILFHAPKIALDSICQRLPGAEFPTIVPLPQNPDKVAVHVVSSEGVFWNTLETIQSLGASSILVLPIEKMLE